MPLQQLWKGRGGTNIVTARDGTVIAFQSMASNKIRRSPDGGRTWGAEIEIGPGATYGNAVVDETSGDILYVNPAKQWLWRSRDHGLTWGARASPCVLTDSASFPTRFPPCSRGSRSNSDRTKAGCSCPPGFRDQSIPTTSQWRPYHYSTAVHSDDGGATWQTSKPFPVLGTGEAALAEISDGSILYNSREHMTPGNRFMAWSYDGGELWLNAYRMADLPDGPRGSSYGCMGGMIRLPIDGRDVLIYSNLDTDAGRMPEQVGASITKGREKITAWVSLDGGRTWPVKRLVYDGPARLLQSGRRTNGYAQSGKSLLAV